MSSLMLLARRWVRKGFVTVLASERLLSCVRSFMPLAMWRVVIALIAMTACVPLYSCLSSATMLGFVFLPLRLRCHIHQSRFLLSWCRFTSNVFLRSLTYCTWFPFKAALQLCSQDRCFFLTNWQRKHKFRLWYLPGSLRASMIRNSIDIIFSGGPCHFLIASLHGQERQS